MAEKMKTRGSCSLDMNSLLLSGSENSKPLAAGEAPRHFMVFNIRSHAVGPGAKIP